ncbi:MAG: Retroviral aspartyl protease [Acidobacteria bacterium]|nr:MAG: Retroviral aspartyl protease [Acidobacteriota bacterium]
MGRFDVDVTISNPAARERSATAKLLVDTGATLPWIPRSTLESIGIAPLGRRGFLLADGRRVERETGNVILTLDGVTIGATVVFAQAGLEALGVAVDPVQGKLLHRDLMAMGARAF